MSGTNKQQTRVSGAMAGAPPTAAGTPATAASTPAASEKEPAPAIPEQKKPMADPPTPEPIIDPVREQAILHLQTHLADLKTVVMAFNHKVEGKFAELVAYLKENL